MEYRDAFRLAPDLIYLNAANQSLLPKKVFEAIFQYAVEYEQNPTAGMNRFWGELWERQKSLAKFLGASEFDLFMRSNVTSVLNTFILGLEVEPKGEWLVGEFEYGAIVNVCRMRCERDGFELRTLSLPGTAIALQSLSKQTLLDSIVSQLGPKTRVLVISHVVGGTGLVLPIREISEETHRRGIKLIVDGAYAPGAMRISFDQFPCIDFYGCSLYKWMLGPKGTAFGWVNPRNQGMLKPISAGWSTYERFDPFSGFGGGNRFQETFLLSGCHDFSPFLAIRETLELWDEWGREAVWARMRGLREVACRLIEEKLGWLALRSEDLELQGPMLAFRIPDKLQPTGDRLVHDLVQRFKIQANAFAIRGSWNLGISPHVYNSPEELQSLHKSLAALI